MRASSGLRFTSLARQECDPLLSSVTIVSAENKDFHDDLRLLCNEGKLKDAIRLLDLETRHLFPSDYIHLLQACINKKALAEGIHVHAHIFNTGFRPTLYLWTAVMNMYVQCKSLTDARKVFDHMPERDLLTWNTMITAYAKQGKPHLAFELFCLLELDSLQPDMVTIIGILKACSTASYLKLGKYIHCHIIKFGIEISLFSSNTLITMYSKCGSINDARCIFDGMEERSVVSWTAMVAGYSKHGRYEQALNMYRAMTANGIAPNEVTFVCVLNACAGLGNLEQGKLICIDVRKSGIKPNIMMENACIDMYVKCGSLNSAWQVFMNMAERDVVTWTTMIAGCAEQGFSEEAFSLFREMEQEGHELGDVSLVSNFNAFASLGDLEQAKAMHHLLLKFLNKPNDFVGSALVDMYVKCKSIEDAWQAFCQMPKQDVILWNAMLTGYASQGDVEESLRLLEQMDAAEVKANETTFSIILNTCANAVALKHGKSLHARVVKLGMDGDSFIGSGLVNMYARSGLIEEAEDVFCLVTKQDVVLYTSMIAGYAQHNQSFKALHLADRMWEQGMKPNHVTFVNVLTACSHAGLMEEGVFHFCLMTEGWGVKPVTEHYVCVVDLLARAGCLDEAELYVKKMIRKPDAMVWRALLSACRNLGDVERAKSITDCVVEIQPGDEGAFILLSNIYGAGCMDD